MIDVALRILDRVLALVERGEKAYDAHQAAKREREKQRAESRPGDQRRALRVTTPTAPPFGGHEGPGP